MPQIQKRVSQQISKKELKDPEVRNIHEQIPEPSKPETSRAALGPHN
jgi:hypothetical protein